MELTAISRRGQQLVREGKLLLPKQPSPPWRQLTLAVTRSKAPRNGREMLSARSLYNRVDYEMAYLERKGFEWWGYRA